MRLLSSPPGFENPAASLILESTVVQKLDVFGYNPRSQIPGEHTWIKRARVRNRAGLVLILIIAFSSKETSSS